ncbi:hypothetical protein Tco_1183549 [Tanacetum coccineum]
MTESNKKQYITDAKVMNYLLQAIPNDIYNLVDACKNAKEMWERIKLLMFGSDFTNHDGRVDIQTKNAGYSGNDNKNAGRQNKNQAFNAGNGNYDNNQIVQRVPQTKEQMLLAMKDEAESNLNDAENDFMLDNSFEDETLEELTATNHGKCKIVINTSDDDQIDSNIIFDDPYVENNGGSDEHDSTAHDQYHDVKIMAYNALREAENKK